jgi:hypothetical protein
VGKANEGEPASKGGREVGKEGRREEKEKWGSKERGRIIIIIN